MDYLVNVTEPETEMMLETPFPLDYFLPKFKKMFYRWSGMIHKTLSDNHGLIRKVGVP